MRGALILILLVLSAGHLCAQDWTPVHIVGM